MSDGLYIPKEWRGPLTLVDIGHIVSMDDDPRGMRYDAKLITTVTTFNKVALRIKYDDNFADVRLDPQQALLAGLSLSRLSWMALDQGDDDARST